MSIQVADYGWKYVLKCFQLLQGEGIFYLFFGAVLVYLFATRRKETWRKWILIYFLGLAITVYNPVFVTPLVDKLHMTDEYYRLIWLLPFTVGIAWLVVTLIQSCSKRWMKAMMLAVSCVLLAFPGKSILARGLTVAENVYKVPNDLIEICDAIHEDSNGESVMAAMDFELVVLMGQYDPSIQLALSYSEVSFMRTYVDIDYKTWFPPNLLSQMHIFRVLYQEEEIEGQEFHGALKYLGADYVVVNKEYPHMEYLYTQGLIFLQETDHYVLLKLEGEQD
jgi:hypothetical protein